MTQIVGNVLIASVTYNMRKKSITELCIDVKCTALYRIIEKQVIGFDTVNDWLNFIPEYLRYFLSTNFATAGTLMSHKVNNCRKRLVERSQCVARQRLM